MIINYVPPPATAPPVRHYDEEPAILRESSPLGLTATTLTTTTRQSKVTGFQNDMNPVTGRDSVKSKGDRGTYSKSQNSGHKPAQGQEKAKAKERKQKHVVNPLDPTEAVPTQGASRGSNTKISRDSETADTDHKSTGPFPQAGADVGNISTEMGNLHLLDRDENAPKHPGQIPDEQGFQRHYDDHSTFTTPTGGLY